MSRVAAVAHKLSGVPGAASALVDRPTAGAGSRRRGPLLPRRRHRPARTGPTTTSVPTCSVPTSSGSARGASPSCRSRRSSTGTPPGATSTVSSPSPSTTRCSVCSSTPRRSSRSTVRPRPCSSSPTSSASIHRSGPARPRTLDPTSCATLCASGLVTLGSHTATHASLPDVDAATSGPRELADSRAWLEDLTGSPVDLFAYPFGHHDAPSEAATDAAGYRAACTFTFGRVTDRRRRRPRSRASASGPTHDRFRLARQLARAARGAW